MYGYGVNCNGGVLGAANFKDEDNFCRVINDGSAEMYCDSDYVSLKSKSHHN